MRRRSRELAKWPSKDFQISPEVNKFGELTFATELIESLQIVEAVGALLTLSAARVTLADALTAPELLHVNKLLN